MNFIFISPHFPENYWNFCSQLKKNGVNVLGIGDTAYNSLRYELRQALTEYYRVDSMENYDQMYRAVAYFAFKYGKIDWLESNNEHWLEQDARLRTDFNITTGYRAEELACLVKKSSMKKYYEKAGIPTAPWCMVDTTENCLAFAQRVGYPVIVKPDRGVGAEFTWKLCNPHDVEVFLYTKPAKSFIMEKFVEGEICSYDAIINTKGEPLFESGNITPISIMDAVNNKDTVYFYMVKELAEDMRAAGRRCADAFGVKGRFIHFEFFRLSRDQEGIGKAGQLAGLEVNMRPSGGYSPDMLNYANSTNVYRIWADMIAFDENRQKAYPERYYCAFAGRRDQKEYQHSHIEVLSRYRSNITLSDRLPEVLARGMGDQMYLAKFAEKDQVNEFIEFVSAKQEAGQ